MWWRDRNLLGLEVLVLSLEFSEVPMIDWCLPSLYVGTLGVWKAQLCCVATAQLSCFALLCRVLF